MTATDRPDPIRADLIDSRAGRRVRHGFFTRTGGVSGGLYRGLNVGLGSSDRREDVIENRRRVAGWLGVEEPRLVAPYQVHSPDVVIVDAPFSGERPQADAIVTATPGLAIGVHTADCGPVLFADAEAGVIGAAHAGWKGIVNGVLPATVRAMQSAFGCDPADIVAGVGPCIGPVKFEVGHDVAAEIQAAVGERVVIEGAENGEGAERSAPSAPSPLSAPSPKPHINLWLAAQSQLHHAGVGEIEVARICTASNTHEWFSHREEKGKTGRFGVLIELDE